MTLRVKDNICILCNERGSETWLMNAEHEVKSDRTETSMITGVYARLL